MGLILFVVLAGMPSEARDAPYLQPAGADEAPLVQVERGTWRARWVEAALPQPHRFVLEIEAARGAPPVAGVVVKGSLQVGAPRIVEVGRDGTVTSRVDVEMLEVYRGDIVVQLRLSDGSLTGPVKVRGSGPAPSADPDPPPSTTGGLRGPVELNLCGGLDDLLWHGEPGVPGQTCGECLDGRLICDGPNSFRCDSATRANACGGCSALTGAPGDACGECADGRLTCDDAGELFCADATTRNACGGCAVLDGQPGWLCQREGAARGVWLCAEPTRVECLLVR